MSKENYTKVITAKTSSPDAFEKICQVAKWWAKEYEGKSEKQNDIFTVRFKNGDMYKMKVSEIIPNKKITWAVIDSYQGWNNTPAEWDGTKIIWEVSPKEDGTEIKMTHRGLVPEFECFDNCRQGWDYLIQESLQKLLNNNKGLPV
jgi:hypothetical protein